MRQKFRVYCCAINTHGDPCKREVEKVGNYCGHHDPNRRRCKHMYADDTQCEAPPIKGADVCIAHGGKTLPVQKQARARLLAAVEPALNTLERAMECADWPTAVRAALGILDRAGFGVMTKITIDGTKTNDLKDEPMEALKSRAMLILQRIEERQEKIRQRQLTAAPQGEVIEGEALH